MPWKEWTVVEHRLEFVSLANKPGAVVAVLCRRFGISREVGYKWIERYRCEGPGGLEDRPRRPHRSPLRCLDQVERAVLAVRDDHPAWGARKIRAVLLRGGASPPAASTIQAILRRNGRIRPEDSAAHKPHVRFEHGHPNDLWQMDFKGPIDTDAGRCHPLTVLDDHSRYALAVRACVDTREATVRGVLTGVLERYGLPRRLLCDNGPPWGALQSDGTAWTRLSVWLLRLGIGVSHGRPYHPQTQGKEERFHRTLKAEAIAARRFSDHPQSQRVFDEFRRSYNHDRPHEALNYATPSSRYEPSKRAYPATLAPIEYDTQDTVRRVRSNGLIRFAGAQWRVGNAFAGEPVAIRPTARDGEYDVWFCQHKVRKINLREQE
jgi:transposase InsO family protein